MPSAHLNLKEDEVVKLVLEFLHNRELNITQLSLERETGVINGVYSDDMLFLRQLILDGQWDDVLEFIQPLESIDGFDGKQFKYIVHKHKYIELLCIKSEAGALHTPDMAVDEVVKCLNELEKCTPSQEDYSSLCLLLTLPRLADHTEYKNWNPSSARVECFRAIYPLVEKYLPAERKAVPATDKSKGSHHMTAKNDRLVQLLIKGLLYEYCVEYCQHKATSSSAEGHEVQFGGILDGTGFTDADLSLPSWLQSIPADIFACPFEQKTLNVDIERLEKPCLEASWTEHMLVTPIKPKTFPHSAMPSSRPRSAADIMSRSLNPHLDGLPFGLASQRHLMALSVGDLSSMSKSYASFHLTGKKSMNTSVDRLFEEADVFTSSNGDIPNGANNFTKTLPSSPPPMPPPRRPRSKSPEKKPKVEPPPAVNCLPSTKTVAKRDDRTGLYKTPVKDAEKEKPEKDISPSKVTPELYKEFQRQKLKLQEIVNLQEKQNEEYIKHMLEMKAQNQSKTMTDNRIKEAIIENCTKDSPTIENNVSNISNEVKILRPVTEMDGNTPRTNAITQITSTPKQQGTQGPKLNSTLTQISPVQVLNLRIADGAASHAVANAVTEGHHDATRSAVPAARGIGPQQQVVTSIRPAGVESPSATAICQKVGPYQSECDGSSSTRLPAVDSQQQIPLNKAKHGVVGMNVKSPPSSTTNGDTDSLNAKPRFVPVTSLEDVQAIRAAEFHPNGKLYAIGSNSKTLRICAHPKVTDIRENHQVYQPTVLFKRTKHHKGSIYCLGWNATGDLLATGSNDKTIKLMRFNPETCNIEGEEIELSMHDGTIRDVCFVEDMSNKSSLLISGGAGDCKIYVTDCATGTPFQALSGHTGHILSLYTWGGAMFISGSQDRTIRFWDLRTRGCVNVIPSPSAGTGAVKGAPVAAVAVDPSGRMLVSGQEDASCMLYDIRGNRIIQVFKPHTADVRTIRFSPRAYYLLTGSYDNKVVLTDLQGDLTLPLPSVVVAQHQDKVIQCRWHPTEFSFLSTSADKTATLWGLPAN